ncbi:hypothetical protein PDESU_01017 [Pontiella desulfatans]|uniref:Uncharacterized protein n=1 Tax=Pontiella desulfatans TaxID=2750659 RepID=A0A6C2TYD0_PONDE|nr:hypothetical protein [Pontiella desulfatans]VGO12464.1 hypothetical protein PDESU_01017 [Pontiella desulfatans]
MKMFGMKTGVVLGALALVLATSAADKKPAAEMDVVVGMAEGVPGGVVVSTLEIQAKVVGIDYQAREVALLLPGGIVEVIAVGPEAVNFNQIKKGDMVEAVVTEELVIAMGSSDAELGDGEEAVVVAAAEGEQPGAIAIDTVRETAVVVALDGLSRTASLMFEDGSITTVAVRDDIDLTQHRLGEKIVFESTQMVAISVEKQGE